jgi:hypothetical protein
LSSAILYLAIVAIWAVVLVPRWLRPRPAAPQPMPAPAESPDADWREPADPGQDADAVPGAERPHAAGGPVRSQCAGGEAVASVDSGHDADASGDVDAVAGAGGDGDAEQEASPVVSPSEVTRRTEVLKARRRLLSTLITLTAIAVGLVVTRIDAYWIVIPPTVLLGGYVMLLRKFAHIDAERARRAARIRRDAARAGAQEPGPAAPSAADEGSPGSGADAPAEPVGAEVIDISGRIGDQVYDQYSDAANRAVGD